MSAASHETDRIRALLAAGRDTEARDRLALALADAPESAELHHLMARASRTLIDYSSALRHAERACALEPDHAAHHCERAIANHDRGRDAAAREAALVAVRLDPTDWTGHALSGLFISTGDRFSRAAREHAARAVALAPHEAQAHVCQAVVAQRALRFRQARAAIERAVALDPEDAQALTHRGDLAFFNLSKGGRAYLGALGANPHDGQARKSLDDIPMLLFGMLILAAAVIGIAGYLITTRTDTAAQSVPTPASRVIALVGTLTWLIYAWRTVAALPGGIRRHLFRRARLLQDGWSMLIAVIAMTYADLICFAPGAAGWLSAALRWGGHG